ncbi:MAG TPA: hypothetical protein VKH37_06840, partial [Ferruginibacter sp.]|nr:hypothetical protein [Ferruginibacter sp.]
TAYTVDSTMFAVTPVKINYQQFSNGFANVPYDPAKMNWYFHFDNTPNAYTALFNNEANTCDSCMLKNKISLFKVKQLLFYKDHQLQIRNVLITPVIYNKVSSEGKDKAEYFESASFAFNNPDNDNGKIPATAKYIGRSCNTLKLSPTTSTNVAENNILTLNNWSLSNILYNDVKNNSIRAYDTKQSLYPTPKAMLNSKKIDDYDAETVIVPVYDSLGNQLSEQQLVAEVNYDSIYSYTLVQDFYFDFTNEKLYSKLIALATRKPVRTSSGDLIGYKDFWGVAFGNDKKTVAKKIK